MEIFELYVITQKHAFCSLNESVLKRVNRPTEVYLAEYEKMVFSLLNIMTLIGPNIKKLNY